MNTMVREMNWNAVARQEGDAIVELSSANAEEVSGGWLWWAIGAAMLLWPTRAW